MKEIERKLTHGKSLNKDVILDVILSHIALDFLSEKEKVVFLSFYRFNGVDFIARLLNIKNKTIYSIINSICRKLGLKSMHHLRQYGISFYQKLEEVYHQKGILERIRKIVNFGIENNLKVSEVMRIISSETSLIEDEVVLHKKNTAILSAASLVLMNQPSSPPGSD